MFPVSDVIPSRTRPYVTLTLIALNALVFLAELLLRDRLPQAFFAFGLVPAFVSWTGLVTSLFLHAGWLHVLGNMLFLWIFGENVEDRFGHLRFIFFYAFCGAAAALGHVLINPHAIVPVVGASGAVSGVMGAYFVLYPQSRVLTAVFLIVFVDLIEVPAVVFLGIWFVLQVFSGAGSLGVAAAGVGFAAGAAAAVAWRMVERRRRISYP